MARCTLYFNFDASCLNAYCDFGILYLCRLARKYSIEYLKSIDFTPFDTYPVSISVNFVTYITMNISLQSILNFYQLHIFRIFFKVIFLILKKNLKLFAEIFILRILLNLFAYVHITNFTRHSSSAL